jgi:hypothetical protein
VDNLYIDREDYTVRVDAESHPGFLRICMQPAPAGCGNRHKKFACIAHQVGGFFRFLFPSLAFFICMQPVSHSHTHAAADGLKALDITAQPLWPCCPFFVVVRLCTWMAQLTFQSGSCSPTRNGNVCARGSTRWFQISLPA